MEAKIVEEQFDNAEQLEDEHGYTAGLFNTRSIAVVSNKLRFVQDFVHVNKLIKEDTNEVPSNDEAFQRIARARPTIFSKIDLKNAFLQVLLRECDRPITSFTCGARRYRFLTTPLGLKHIPSAFQRRIKSLLQEYGCADFTHNHVDDVIIFSPDVATHVEHVKQVLRALNAVALTLNEEKSHFFCHTGATAGHVVDDYWVRARHAPYQ